MEDKIVQRAVVMILERIYEVDFCDTSYGFRPGRSCHQALSMLGQHIATKKVNWISDADIAGFFDNVCHEKLVELLGARIKDPRMLWLIGRFLKAGVMIEGLRDDNWRSLVKYREAARRMALRWLRRRSQNSGLSWDAFNAYLRQHPLPIPGRIVDLIAMARGM